jgi:hypothetical protein
MNYVEAEKEQQTQGSQKETSETPKEGSTPKFEEILAIKKDSEQNVQEVNISLSTPEVSESYGFSSQEISESYGSSSQEVQELNDASSQLIFVEVSDLITSLANDSTLVLINDKVNLDSYDKLSQESDYSSDDSRAGDTDSEYDSDNSWF